MYSMSFKVRFVTSSFLFNLFYPVWVDKAQIPCRIASTRWKAFQGVFFFASHWGSACGESLVKEKARKTQDQVKFLLNFKICLRFDSWCITKDHYLPSACTSLRLVWFEQKRSLQFSTGGTLSSVDSKPHKRKILQRICVCQFCIGLKLLIFLCF